ncbi:MAG: thermonuclease family protein [Proteobacteria bacterium]|nr:thermonuclease family protein [Pseudomonadota bacterium]
MHRSPGFLFLCAVTIAAIVALARLYGPGEGRSRPHPQAPGQAGPGQAGPGQAGPGQRGPGESARIVGVAHVTDGDSLVIDGTRIRIWGIDAPEYDQICGDTSGRDYRCGQAATRALLGRLRGASVTCHARERDRYDRIVAQCMLGKEDIGRWMVGEGWAIAYPNAAQHAYAADQEVARRARRGLWQGKFEEPARWRRAKRER